MKLEGDYLFEAPVNEVWKALLDPAVLAAVMPGCEKLELVDGSYVGDLNIKVGPVQGKFSGKVDLKDQAEPTSYTMLVDGRGAPGFVKATAHVRLEPEGEHTRMHYDADAQVGGKIASVGQRLLEASSRAITKQSLEGLNENIKIRAGQTPAPPEQEPEYTAPAPAPAAAPASKMNGTSHSVEVRHVDAPPVVAKPKPAPTPVPPPVAFKKVDEKAMAAAVAKELSAQFLPSRTLVFILGLIAGAVLMWFGVHR